MKRISKVIAILVFMTFTLILCGCKGDTNTDTYSEKVTEISEQVEQIRELNIDDPSNSESYQALLEKVQKIEALFRQLSELDTPEEYKSAQEHFTTALSQITEAYEQFDSINPSHIPIDDEVSTSYTQALNTYFSAINSYKLGFVEMQDSKSYNISSVDK